MILLMSTKDWYKNKKKFVVPKDYMIVDGTEDDDGKLVAFTNMITMDGFNPPPKLTKLASKEMDIDVDDIIDYDSLEKLEDNYFHGMKLTNAMMSVVAGQLNSDINLFIILRPKVFKRFKKKLLKRYKELFPVDFTFVEAFTGDVKDHKKSLRDSFSDDETAQLSKALEKNEKSQEKRYKKFSKKRKKKKY